MKQVRYDRAALRALYRHKNMRERIEEKIAAYAADPASMANMVKRLTTGDLRLRIGNFRVIFRETPTHIDVLDLGLRGDVYG
jgi:mRNA interferase RelE/StbE